VEAGIIISVKRKTSLMKKYLLYTLIVSVVLSSCKKNFEDRLIGNWRLVSSYKQRAFDRDHFITGYETGVFTFNENGTAKYVSTTDTLNGTWNVDRYFADEASYKELRVELFNFPRNQYLFWEFDDFNFQDNWKEIRARDFSLSNDRIYEFRRQ
jgi:hypothetical protein